MQILLACVRGSCWAQNQDRSSVSALVQGLGLPGTRPHGALRANWRAEGGALRRDNSAVQWAGSRDRPWPMGALLRDGRKW